MQQIYPDLWQSTRYSNGDLNTHAYLLQHAAGNILFYNTGYEADLDHIAALGGLRYQLLTHRDEAGPSLRTIRQRFASTLMFAGEEADAIARYAQADRHFKEGDHCLHDIHILSTPGHTSGSTSFFYTSPYGKTYLFTGDTFFQWHGRWATLIVESAGGSKPLLIQSLAKLRNQEIDVVISSGFVGDTGIVEVNSEEWFGAIDNEIARLERINEIN